MSKKIKVLFLDDDILNHFSLDYILKEKKYPFEIHREVCPLSAIDSVLANSYDCIITDFNMPRLDGREFVSFLRKIEYPLPPVIGFSGELSPDKSFGSDLGLTKIFKKNELAECLYFIHELICKGRSIC